MTSAEEFEELRHSSRPRSLEARSTCCAQRASGGSSTSANGFPNRCSPTHIKTPSAQRS
jgi:hypothetical protein